MQRMKREEMERARHDAVALQRKFEDRQAQVEEERRRSEEETAALMQDQHRRTRQRELEGKRQAEAQGPPLHPLPPPRALPFPCVYWVRAGSCAHAMFLPLAAGMRLTYPRRGHANSRAARDRSAARRQNGDFGGGLADIPQRVGREHGLSETG